MSRHLLAATAILALTGVAVAQSPQPYAGFEMRTIKA
jgi:hypothetical protein